MVFLAICLVLMDKISHAFITKDIEDKNIF